MTATTDHTKQDTDPSRHWPLVLVLAGFFVELTLIATAFKHLVDFNCLENWPQRACRSASFAAVAVYCLMGVAVLLYMLRPAPIRTLVATAGDRIWPLGLNAVGVVIALIPLAFLNGAAGATGLVPAMLLWTVGMGLMMAGLVVFIAPLTRWRAYLGAQWTALLPAALTAMVAPSLSQALQPIWSIDWIANQTFGAVAWVMRAGGYDLYTDPVNKIIGTDPFYISVANVCSGIEGIALVTLFVSLYLWLFRADLRFPLALLLYPVGIAASVGFNILRISILLFIGLEGNPELAVGGFHSHAGWMMFTLVALGVIALAQTVPALRKAVPLSDAPGGAAQDTLPPFWRDPVVAQILPFAIFMLSALVASTLSQTPSAVYPIRAGLMIAVLALLLPYYRRLPWRMDPVAVAVGAVIAGYWIAIPVAATDAPAPYGTLSGALLVMWFVARGLGTVVLVPIIEEAFFRGYLERRLRFGSTPLFLIIAAVVTAILFAALHGRWTEAFVAGILFSWVAWRRDNLTDAIVAHGVANGLIFAAAVITGNLAMI